MYIIQICNAQEGNGPTISPETEGREEIVGPRSTVHEGIYFAPFHE